MRTYGKVFSIDKTGLLRYIGYHLNWLAINRTDWLSIEQNSYEQNRIPIDRTEWLLIEQDGYRQNRMAIDRTEWLSIEKIGNRLNRRAIDRTEWLHFCHTYHLISDLVRRSALKYKIFQYCFSSLTRGLSRLFGGNQLSELGGRRQRKDRAISQIKLAG